MKAFRGGIRALRRRLMQWLMLTPVLASPLLAQPVSLQAVVTPSTTISKDSHVVTFALHGFIEFKSLSDLFPYIDSQTQRWKGSLDDAGRQRSRANCCAAELRAVLFP